MSIYSYKQTWNEKYTKKKACNENTLAMKFIQTFSVFSLYFTSHKKTVLLHTKKTLQIK